jgi:hypothetical protein
MPPLVLGLVGLVGDGAGVGAVGLVVLPDMLPPAEPPVVAPAPAPARLSCRQLSRCWPVRPTHLLGTSVDAPVLAEPLAPVFAEPLAPLPAAPLVLLPLPSEPPALPPADAPPLTLEPDVPLAPVLPDVEPEVCAIAAEPRARSAAAVAAVSVFNIMM